MGHKLAGCERTETEALDFEVAVEVVIVAPGAETGIADQVDFGEEEQMFSEQADTATEKMADLWKSPTTIKDSGARPVLGGAGEEGEADGEPSEAATEEVGLVDTGGTSIGIAALVAERK